MPVRIIYYQGHHRAWKGMDRACPEIFSFTKWIGHGTVHGFQCPPGHGTYPCSARARRAFDDGQPYHAAQHWSIKIIGDKSPPKFAHLRCGVHMSEGKRFTIT